MPNITYNLDIPAANNDPSEDQPDMLVNTNAVDTILQVDHYGFNNNKGGEHKQVTLTDESAPGLLTGDGVLFCNTFKGASYPHWQNSAGSFPLTGPTLNATTGYTYLAQNLLMQWGLVATNGAATQAVSFSLTFDANPYNIQVTAVQQGGGASISANFGVEGASESPSGFTVAKANFTAGTYPFFYWSAIGLRA